MQEWVVVPRQVRTVHGKQTVHYFRKARRPFSVAFWDFFFGACQWIDWHSAKLEREHPYVWVLDGYVLFRLHYPLRLD